MSYRITYVVEKMPGGGIDPAMLDILLDALTRIDMVWLLRHPETPGVYQSGVRYQEEPPGAEDWADIPTCLALGWADCEDLACWRAAELRVRHGVEAKAFAECQMQPDGSRLYHIMVSLPDGSVECPSRELGMR